MDLKYSKKNGASQFMKRKKWFGRRKPRRYFSTMFMHYSGSSKKDDYLGCVRKEKRKKAEVKIGGR